MATFLRDYAYFGTWTGHIRSQGPSSGRVCSQIPQKSPSGIMFFLRLLLQIARQHCIRSFLRYAYFGYVTLPKCQQQRNETKNHQLWFFFFFKNTIWVTSLLLAIIYRILNMQDMQAYIITKIRNKSKVKQIEQAKYYRKKKI